MPRYRAAGRGLCGTVRYAVRGVVEGDRRWPAWTSAGRRCTTSPHGWTRTPRPAANSTSTARWRAGCTDLGTAFHARLTGGRLVDIADGDDPKAKIALIADSDDLIALVTGELDVTKAIASRQVSIKANPFDLLKLRKLL